MEFDLNKKHCYYFNEICKIPHGSLNEKALSDYVVDFAKKRGFDVKQDDMFNVVVKKKASKGYEEFAPIMLQAHLDMVCEKNEGVEFDFTKDAIQTYVDDQGWLHAKGTTLGADDGMGVAYMLAILDDDSLKHPDLECVFTVQEEIGLIGALHLDPSWICSKRMISLDGGGEVCTAVSSAGGCMAIATLPVKRTTTDFSSYQLVVDGLSGGHSGGEIAKEKGNANKLVARVLKELSASGVSYNLVSVNGGEKDNAICRKSIAVFTTNKSLEELLSAIKPTVDAIYETFAQSDSGVHIELSETDDNSLAMDDASTKRVVDYMYLCPNGFRSKSMVIDGLTLTSLNMGIVKTYDDHVMINSSIRSALDCAVDDLILTVTTLASYFDGTVEVEARYPGWNYSEDNQLRARFKEVFAHLYDGKELTLRAGHGGTECSVFKKMDPAMDIVSCGPIASGAHTPEEKLNLESFDRAFTLLTTLIANADTKEFVCPKD